ncbi:SMI1/KNR4 family protein [Clostridium sp. 19966]|uniref:SMI1/KNR4 family protein n=1 Tax=Clostridium sp. 19966 TaxID=2768166 RepID=UPI0028E00ED2|nr:SMI1/KNR4 family protein [Clostridium sp. 19966]MDT8715885.1 SMI1/KNR4 family protein [Clostridium sp. 19966]
MIKINSSKILLNTDYLNSMEKNYGFSFPAEYEDFLKKYNGGRPENNIVKLNNEEIESLCVNYFFGVGINSVDDIFSSINTFNGRIPKGCVPIARVEGGDIICININKDMYGHIYYWDHEKEIQFEFNEIAITDLIHLAESFNKFINIIEPYNVKDEDLSGYKVKSVWIDHDFLKELENNQDN